MISANISDSIKNTDQTKKHSFKMLGRILAVAVPPLLVMGLVMCIYGLINVKNAIDTEAINGLKGTCSALKAALNSTDSGDYTMDSAGNVYKGSYKITDNYTIMDSIKEDSGYYTTFFYGDTCVATSITKSDGERIIGTQCTDAVKSAVLTNGNTFFSKNVTINNENFYVCYMPIKNSDGSIVGMAFAGIPSKDMETSVNSKRNGYIILLILILFLSSITIGTSAISLGKNIKRCNSFVKQLTNGNLRIMIDPRVMNRSDEIGQIAAQLDKFKNHLYNVVSEIKDSSDSIQASGNELGDTAQKTTVSSDEINKAVEDMSKGAVAQAEDIESASKNVVDMGEIIEQIVTKVSNLDKTSSNMKTASDESTSIINELSKSNDKTTEAIDRISKQISTTNDSAQSINQAVELITSIADETSLLSLNASIEAARAGEQGKGFAVVATEIQKLADQSSTSANKIKDIISELLNETRTSVEIMDEVRSTMNEQQQKLNDTKAKFSTVIENVDVSRTETTNIKTDTSKCNEERKKVIDVISNLSAISEENAASTQETTASMQQLNEAISVLAKSAGEFKDMSAKLKEDVSFFKL